MDRQLGDRFYMDNLMFARIRDELDMETNRKREDKTLVANLLNVNDIPKENQDKGNYLKGHISNFCKKVKPDFNGEIAYAGTLGKPENGKILIEFCLKQVEKAREIRKMFATQRASKSLPEEIPSEVQVFNYLNQATKVRIEIMRAIARRIGDARNSEQTSSRKQQVEPRRSGRDQGRQTS